jgi:hypothetical protein
LNKGAPPGIRITQRDLMDGMDIDFSEEQESWNTYKLSDGTTMKVKLVLRGVKRLKKYSPDGNPVYIIQSQNVVRTLDVPKEIKAKPKERTIKPV